MRPGSLGPAAGSLTVLLLCVSCSGSGVTLSDGRSADRLQFADGTVLDAGPRDAPPATPDGAQDSALDAAPPDSPTPGDHGPPPDLTPEDQAPPADAPLPVCTFHTRAMVTAANGHRIESITAYGRYWNFDSDDSYNPFASNGDDLTAVQRYAQGPCQGKAAGTCTFDTRAMITAANGHLIESITAYGRYWNFDSDDSYNPFANNGDTLASVSRYAQGPCQ